MAGRASRIVEAAKRLKGKIDAAPDDPRADVWRAKMAEYQQSIDALKAGRPETAGSGRKGVEVSVPAGLFALRARKGE